MAESLPRWVRKAAIVAAPGVAATAIVCAVAHVPSEIGAALVAVQIILVFLASRLSADLGSGEPQGESDIERNVDLETTLLADVGSEAAAARPTPTAARLSGFPIPVSQAFLESLPDPVIVLNGAREIVAVNRSAREALGVGMMGRDLALSLRHPGVLAAVETVLSGAPSLSEEITLPLAIPRTFTVHVSTVAGTVRTTSDPRVPHVIVVLHDETRAKRAEQSRADFVANASHELRSPLSALIGFIETLRGPAAHDTEAQERFLAIMHSETLRMARLVDDLMSLSRVEINEHVPPREFIDLTEALDDVAETLAVRAARKSMTINVELPPDVPQVVGDRDQLMQVFHNLIDNAVKYGRESTHIDVVVRSIERLPATGSAGISVAVTDRGDGISTIHLPRLTERFYRADEGRSRRMGGTGLGLAIVKHIVNRHRGRLTIESEVGVGSTFTVFLPVTAPNPAPTRDQSVTLSPAASESNDQSAPLSKNRNENVID